MIGERKEIGDLCTSSLLVRMCAVRGCTEFFSVTELDKATNLD